MDKNHFEILLERMRDEFKAVAESAELTRDCLASKIESVRIEFKEEIEDIKLGQSALVEGQAALFEKVDKVDFRLEHLDGRIERIEARLDSYGEDISVLKKASFHQ